MDYYGTICLNDIPEELIRTSDKNGKKYLTVVVGERRKPSQYGYTHYIKAYAKKGEVAEGTNLYIGELKPSHYQSDNQQQSAAPAPADNGAVDDLPWT